MSKKILFVVGSRRKDSFNNQLATITQELLKDKAEIEYLDYKDLPVFSQDLEVPTLDIVNDLREKIKNADLIWIFSPVYNFQIPGTIKNLLDWMSRSLDLSNLSGDSILSNKKITVSSVANSGQDEMFKQYNFLLPFIRMNLLGDFLAFPVNPEAWQTGKLVLSKEDEEKLNKKVEEVLINL